MEDNDKAVAEDRKVHREVTEQHRKELMAALRNHNDDVLREIRATRAELLHRDTATNLRIDSILADRAKSAKGQGGER